jgi:hypothetical protein
MFKTADPDARQRSAVWLRVACLCALCALAILNPLHLGSTSVGAHDSFSEQHSVFELDEEVGLFAFLAVIALAVASFPMWTTHPRVCFRCPAPQLPPPK